MNTKWSYSSKSSLNAWGARVQKMLIVSIIVVLMAAFLPATGALAAPASDGGTTLTGNLEGDWKNKLSTLRGENLFYSQVRFLPADFEDPDDMSRAYDLLHKYGFALKQANAIVFTHPGFDQKGRVLNELQADQTSKDLAMYLHIMRGMRDKIEEEGYPIHRLR